MDSEEGAEREGINSYRDLTVWQRGMELFRAICLATADFPDDERFGLTSQMRRASVSIPSNIAEGQGCLATKELLQFLGMARGSLKEFETQLLLAIDPGYINDAAASECLSMADEVSRMLNALITALDRRGASESWLVLSADDSPDDAVAVPIQSVPSSPHSSLITVLSSLITVFSEPST